MISDDNEGDFKIIMIGRKGAIGRKWPLFQGCVPIHNSDTVKKMKKSLVMIVETLVKIRTEYKPFGLVLGNQHDYTRK